MELGSRCGCGQDVETRWVTVPRGSAVSRSTITGSVAATTASVTAQRRAWRGEISLGRTPRLGGTTPPVAAPAHRPTPLLSEPARSVLFRQRPLLPELRRERWDGACVAVLDRNRRRWRGIRHSPRPKASRSPARRLLELAAVAGAVATALAIYEQRILSELAATPDPDAGGDFTSQRAELAGSSRPMAAGSTSRSADQVVRCSCSMAWGDVGDVRASRFGEASWVQELDRPAVVSQQPEGVRGVAAAVLARAVERGLRSGVERVPRIRGWSVGVGDHPAHDSWQDEQLPDPGGVPAAPTPPTRSTQSQSLPSGAPPRRLRRGRGRRSRRDPTADRDPRAFSSARGHAPRTRKPSVRATCACR